MNEFFEIFILLIKKKKFSNKQFFHFKIKYIHKTKIKLKLNFY
jgi:hypothetical protein